MVAPIYTDTRRARMKTSKKIKAKIEIESKSEKIPPKSKDFQPVPAEQLHILYATAEQIYPRISRYYSLLEIVSMGFFGLDKACKNYNISLGITFPSYASQLIRFSIIDQMREQDYLSVKDRRAWKQYTTEEERYSHILGRYPTHTEVLDLLNIPRQYITPILLFESSMVLNREEGLDLSFIPDKEPEIDICEGIDLKDMIERLDEPVKSTVKKKYLSGLSSQRIADEERLSESGVYLRLQKGINQLRSMVKESIQKRNHATQNV